MYAEERRREIVDEARGAGRVEVAALADRFDVTPETVRRDLTELERHGVLRRVHGGAIPVDRSYGEPTLTDKVGVMAAEKRRIARAALELLPSAGTVLLDAGTTTGELATLFPDRELTVLTNALPVASTLATREHLEVHLIGGRVRGRTMAAVGPWAEELLRDLRVDVAFVATNGMHPERGLSTHDPAEAAAKAAMIAAARRTVLLVDHTKHGTEQLVRYAELAHVDVVVTDAGSDDADLDALRAAGPRVVVA